MDKQRICKICNKKFANGKAMGGHMRSHLAKLPIPQKPKASEDPAASALKPQSSSSSLTSPSIKIQFYRSVNRELSPPTKKSDLAVVDKESDTESQRKNNNPTRKRSKRRPKSVEVLLKSAPEWESVSLLSEISDEEAAMCLLMLSRDKWTKEEKKVVKKDVEEYTIEEEECGNDEQDEDEEFYIPSGVKTQCKYRCETCKKGFRSYQALGGHRASHKNKKVKIYMKEEGEEENAFATDVKPRSFECPFCDKVFDSGQALGGHKKVHFSYFAVPRNPLKSGEKLLDLNLPAPEEDG